MKNPFLDISKYTIVRQYNRLTQKKRSISQNSPKQVKYSYSPDLYQSNFTDSLKYLNKHKRKYSTYDEDEYKLKKIYQSRVIQKDRVQTCGIQQLRYCSNFIKNSSYLFSNLSSTQHYGLVSFSKKYPENLDEYRNKQNFYQFSSKNKFHNKQQQEQKNNNKQNTISQQDIKFQSNKQEYQQYLHHSNIQNILSERSKNINDRCDSSVGGTMLIINTNNPYLVRNDQYNSVADVQSQKLTSQNIIIKRSTFKKSSVFEQLQTNKKLQDTQNNQQNETDYNSGEIIGMRKKSRNSIRSKSKLNSIKLKDPVILDKGVYKPSIISVRGRVFHLNQKILKKY